jgi:hypothetical protein
MSLAYRIFSLPRSGSSWVANWLTDNRTICWHDPCEWAFPSDIERWAAGMSLPAGICCTGSWVHSDWVPAVPTFMLVRPVSEVQESLQRIGLPPLPDKLIDEFEALPFPRVSLKKLLTKKGAEELFRSILPGMPFDWARHACLVKMNVQPTAAEIDRVKAAIHRTGGLQCLG